MKSALNARFHIVIPIALASAALLALGCGPTTPVPDDTKPTFQGEMADQVYTVGEAIDILTLPAATGGDGELTYRLEPAVPGLTFDRGARTLRGRPNTAGTYAMTYTVMDADDNTTDEDTAELTFTITVQKAELPDTAPVFERTVDDQTYTAGARIDDLALPAATGGNGELTYTLEPTVPGLVFDPTERILGGTPTSVGTYSMTYRVVDADENTGDNDAATLSFTITVGEPEYVGTWHFSDVPAPATAVFEKDRFVVIVGDGENGVVPTPPFDRIIRIMVSGTLAAHGSTLTMTVADDGIELTFAAGVAPAQQEALRRIVSDLVMQADDAAVSVVVEAGVMTVTGGPIPALLLTTELTGMPESAPMFTRLVGDRSFMMDVPIAAVTLPSATGGNGTLTYSLVPEIPGLTFDETALTLSGTPTTPGAYDVTYGVVDDDTNTAATDADTQVFTVTVREPDTAGVRGDGG